MVGIKDDCSVFRGLPVITVEDIGDAVDGIVSVLGVSVGCLLTKTVSIFVGRGLFTGTFIETETGKGVGSIDVLLVGKSDVVGANVSCVFTFEISVSAFNVVEVNIRQTLK